MLLSTGRLISTITLCGLALTVPVRAADGVRLTTVAAANGFTYQWMPTEGAATLLRPGVRIVIRAGRLFYEVNNATPVADSAPRFDGRDLVISTKLAEHLRNIALAFPDAQDAPRQSALDAPAAAAAESGIRLYARQVPGREAIELRGTGPASTAVQITLTGELSSDLPIAVLSRKIVITATDGSFSADVSYGQDTHPRTTLIATAATLSGVSSTEARVVIGVPSPQIKSSGLDDWPAK